MAGLGGANMKSIAALAFTLMTSAAWPQALVPLPPPTQPVTRTFVPLHRYFVDPTGGSDANSGTSVAQAWKTLNHPGLVCGDVVALKPGTHAQGFRYGEWGTPGGCPSTSGGIDGQGGIYFVALVCAGPDVMACKLDSTISPITLGYDPVRITAPNWSVQGVWATQGPGPTYPGSSEQTGCFIGDNQGSAGGPMKYISFVNNIASVCNLSGFATGGGGCDPTTQGCSFDYIAVLGSLSFNGANSHTGDNGWFCGSGVSLFPGSPFNTPDTHIYVSQYFGAYNSNSGSTPAVECDAAFRAGHHPHTDGAGLIFDTYATGYAIPGSWDKTAVLENAAIWKSGNACVQVFPQGNGTTDDKGQYIVENVSCYSNLQDPRAGCGAELLYNGLYPTGPGRYQARNNIFYLTELTCGGAPVVDDGQGDIGFIFASVLLAGNAAHAVVLDGAKIDVSNNWVFQTQLATIVRPGQTLPGMYVVDNSSATTPTFPCNSDSAPFSPPCYEATWHFGTGNTYADPVMTNPSALFSTTPDCTGFTSVTRCMNEKYGVYDKLKPTVAPLTVGYQKPKPCGPNVRYPAWLKGMNYLWIPSGYVDNFSVQQRSDGASRPCNL